MEKKDYENNTLPEILAELRRVNRRMNGERVYDLYVPPKDLDGPCKVLPQTLADIADRIEKAAKEAKMATDPEGVRRTLEHVQQWLTSITQWHSREDRMATVCVTADAAFYFLDEIDKALKEGR